MYVHPSVWAVAARNTSVQSSSLSPAQLTESSSLQAVAASNTGNDVCAEVLLMTQSSPAHRVQLTAGCRCQQYWQ
eukprot:gene2400-5347_t